MIHDIFSKWNDTITKFYNHVNFREDAAMSNSCFYLRPEKDDNKVILEDKDLEVIGSSGVIQYDDTNVILQHIESGLWFSYKVLTLHERKNTTD